MMSPVDADAIPLYTGPRAGDSAAHPFFTADAAARSLNRARLVELPGVTGAAELLGRSASELLSAAAVTALVRAAADRLALDPDDPALLRAFDAAFDAPPTRPAALAVAEAVGRRLGALLLMLWRGDAANRAARPEWDEAHWAFWRAVERVVVGGGLLAGRLGEATVPAAGAFLAAAGCPIAVERSPYGNAIAIAGLARHAPAGAERMLLFDFGHTAVKCGLATYRQGALAGLERRPSLPPPCEDGWPAHAGAAWARPRWERMAAAITAAWAAEVVPGQGERVAVGLCLASHLHDGHPIGRDRGCYTALGELAPHLATFLRDDLRARLGLFRALAVLHDGLAAASTRAGEPHTVVLTLGTAIGAGYPLGEVGLRAMKLGL
ncbi:MAG TPA: hypothetical protein PLH39_02935 [Promineifilum sp.]|nr:hypothetical protein [Promineifilum sp.]